MDSVGDADQLDDDDLFVTREPWWTPEARVLTGAGLVLLGLFGGSLLQILSFFLDGDGSDSRWEQWTVYGGPPGVLGLVAAVLAAPARRQTRSAMLQGAAVAVVVVGAVVALIVAGGYLVIANSDDARF